MVPAGGILNGGRRGGQIVLPRYPGKPEVVDKSGAGVGEGDGILIVGLAPVKVMLAAPLEGAGTGRNSKKEG